MKAITLLTAVFLGVSLGAQAGRFDSGFARGGLIPDNTATGSDLCPAGGLRPVTESVSVRMSRCGDRNADLHAYLSYEGNQLVLLNRAGTGAGPEPIYTSRSMNAGSSKAIPPDAGSAGDLPSSEIGGEPAEAYPADGREMGPGDMSVSGATGVYGAGGPMSYSGSGSLGPMNLALWGLGVCVAGAGLGWRIYARVRAQY